MYKSKIIGVVVRAYNEEKFIASVINSIPDFVDNIYVANDASTDNTPNIISELSKYDSRLIQINRPVRGGVGAATISGFEKALCDNNEIVVIIDGDGQMDPTMIDQFLDPLISDKADYVKGNRLSSREHKEEMPAWRAFGNSILTILNRIASGYWNISDPQNGYAAITKNTLVKLDLDKINKGFAYENDILVKLNVIGAKVMDIPHPAVYRNQNSKISYPQFILATSWLLFSDFFWRVWKKYLIYKLRMAGKDIGYHLDKKMD